MNQFYLDLLEIRLTCKFNDDFLKHIALSIDEILEEGGIIKVNRPSINISDNLLVTLEDLRGSHQEFLKSNFEISDSLDKIIDALKSW